MIKDFDRPATSLTPGYSSRGVTADRRAPQPVIAGEHVFRRQEDYEDDDIDGVEEAVAEALSGR